VKPNHDDINLSGFD